MSKPNQQPLSTTAQRSFRTRAGSGDAGRQEASQITGPGLSDEKLIQQRKVLETLVARTSYPEWKMRYKRALWLIDAQIARSKG